MARAQWTVLIDGESGRFDAYPTRAAARRVARIFAGQWPGHRYTVRKEHP